MLDVAEQIERLGGEAPWGLGRQPRATNFGWKVIRVDYVG
jgi:hypothetical protein